MPRATQWLFSASVRLVSRGGQRMRPLGRLRGPQTCSAGESRIGIPAAWDPGRLRAPGEGLLSTSFETPPLSKRVGRALPPREKQEWARKFRSQLNVQIFKITQDAHKALQPGNTATSVIIGEPPPSSLKKDSRPASQHFGGETTWIQFYLYKGIWWKIFYMGKLI